MTVRKSRSRSGYGIDGFGDERPRIKKSTRSAASKNKEQMYLITVKFPHGKTMPVRAYGEKGLKTAIGLVKKHAPSAKYTFKKV